MLLEIIAVHDKALGAYMRPFFAQTTGQAIRMFQDEVNTKDSEISKHPEDYDLYHLGTWNDNTGYTEMLGDGPKRLATAKQLKTQ